MLRQEGTIVSRIFVPVTLDIQFVMIAPWCFVPLIVVLGLDGTY